MLNFSFAVGLLHAFTSDPDAPLMFYEPHIDNAVVGRCRIDDGSDKAASCDIIFAFSTN